MNNKIQQLNSPRSLFNSNKTNRKKYRNLLKSQSNL